MSEAPRTSGRRGLPLRPTLTALVVGVALIAGCSSPPDQPATGTIQPGDASIVMHVGSEAGVSHAPIDANKMIAALTDDEWAKICDWEADRLGGYGHNADCEANFVPMVPPDQATCVTAIHITFPCDLIVSDFEACIDERVEDPCALNFPACTPIGICHDPPDARGDGT
jgi:hypothetical protein